MKTFILFFCLIIAGCTSIAGCSIIEEKRLGFIYDSIDVTQNDSLAKIDKGLNLSKDSGVYYYRFSILKSQYYAVRRDYDKAEQPIYDLLNKIDINKIMKWDNDDHKFSLDSYVEQTHAYSQLKTKGFQNVIRDLIASKKFIKSEDDEAALDLDIGLIYFLYGDINSAKITINELNSKNLKLKDVDLLTDVKYFNMILGLNKPPEQTIKDDFIGMSMPIQRFVKRMEYNREIIKFELPWDVDISEKGIIYKYPH